MPKPFVEEAGTYFAAKANTPGKEIWLQHAISCCAFQHLCEHLNTQ
jgi:hypothetical protein